MDKATRLALIFSALAGFGIVVVSNSPKEQGENAPQHSDSVIGPNESGTLRAEAAGAWRAGPPAGTPSEPAGRAPTVVVTIPAVKATEELPQKATSIAGDRASLARELQRELRRVGCYDGEINGAWTTSTRQAMKAFTDRVNATLPIKEPDAVLLALVQGHQHKACGAPCPAGQGVTDDGRCMPNAVLTHLARKEPKRTAANKSPSAEQVTPATGWSTTTNAVATLPSSPIEGQMALAGPKAEFDLAAPIAKPQLRRDRSPDTRREVTRDWKADLWKRPAN
jgi:hypothetical protein